MHKLIKKGFTLIELLVVIAIIGILITVGSVSYQKAVRLSRDSKRKTDLEQIRQALETYRAENGSYPDSITWKNDLESGFIATVPSDLENPYTYTPNGTNTTYNLCATLESVTPPSYCVTQP
ncbi:prepilin-type N-terminal cleavage/methylation domain-containing protein [Candidatus Woesebacteria bacterium]|nr:prepilin-type N-terminal cleavage/methylation domain-containing protein [Candidatus Woesebacteria bacterium]